MEQLTKFATCQLWTCFGGKEFALKLKDEKSDVFVAATHLGVDYPFMVEEFSIDSATYEWDAILQQKADKWLTDGSLRDSTHSRNCDDKMVAKEAHVVRRSAAKTRRVRPTIKCRFCYLMYMTDEERHEHEKMWHGAKLNALNQPAPREINKVNKINNLPTLCEQLCAPQGNRQVYARN